MFGDPIEEHSGHLWVLLWEIACQIAWIPASLVESQVPTEPSVGLPGKFRYADMPHWPPMMRDMASLLATSHIKPSPLTPLVSLSWPLFKLFHLASDSTTSHPFRGKVTALGSSPALSTLRLLQSCRKMASTWKCVGLLLIIRPLMSGELA